MLIVYMKHKHEIKLEGLTPRQRLLQLKYIQCRKNNGCCNCITTDEERKSCIKPIVCKHIPKYSNSYIKRNEEVVRNEL